jgi:hypothetical protein
VVFKFIRSRFVTPLSIAYPWILRRGSGRVREVEKRGTSGGRRDPTERMKSDFGGA